MQAMTEHLPPGRRSILCVPAGDQRKVAKALASAADEVVLDLEDAVAMGDKASARQALFDTEWPALREGQRLAVRVNAAGTPWCHRDLEAVVSSSVPATSIVLPKVDSRGDLDFAERLLDGLEAEATSSVRLGIQALIETARGLVALADTVVRTDRLGSLIIGYADLAASLGRRSGLEPGSWLAAQERLLSCARSAGIEAVDGPHLGVADDELFRAAANRAASLGFDAKWVIHPAQLDGVSAAFEPTSVEIDRATRVLKSLEHGAGAAQLDGELIDEAMAVAARRVLARVRS